MKTIKCKMWKTGEKQEGPQARSEMQNKRTYYKKKRTVISIGSFQWHYIRQNFWMTGKRNTGSMVFKQFQTTYILKCTLRFAVHDMIW